MAELKKPKDWRAKPFSLFNRSLTLNVSSPAPTSTPKACDNVSPSASPSKGSRFHSSIASMKGKVRMLRSLFEAPPKPSMVKQEPASDPSIKLRAVKSMRPEQTRFHYGFASMGIRLPDTEDRIVVYLTSLRSVRRTYEDCYAVRMIFRGFRVWVDERDTSMDISYRKELQNVLGEKNVSLPQVFIRGYYVGGADVIKSMYETGQMVKVLEGFPKMEPGVLCERCGDVRFVPCSACSGSRKVYDEKEDLLKRCSECNENGLIRCTDCCS